MIRTIAVLTSKFNSVQRSIWNWAKSAIRLSWPRCWKSCHRTPRNNRLYSCDWNRRNHWWKRKARMLNLRKRPMPPDMLMMLLNCLKQQWEDLLDKDRQLVFRRSSLDSFPSTSSTSTTSRAREWFASLIRCTRDEWSSRAATTRLHEIVFECEEVSVQVERHRFREWALTNRCQRSSEQNFSASWTLLRE